MTSHTDVLSLVSAQATATPDAVAIVCSEVVTYGELMRRTGRIAAALRTHDLPPESPVAVLALRNADLVATLLAIWQVGACYVPLDLDDPPARHALMVRSAGCRVMVGTGALLAGLREAVRGDTTTDGDDGTLLDRPWLAIDALPEAETLPTSEDGVTPGAGLDGNHLAYVLFTSGSTGAPKGVEVEHGSIVNLLLAARDLIGFGPADRYLAVSTIGFDISVAELFIPLITGGSLLLRDRHLLLDPFRVANEIRTHGVTVVQTGPTVWATLLSAVRDIPRVRVAISTGEAVAPALADRLVHVADQAWNLYGPTEATVWATGHRLSHGVPSDPQLKVSTVSAPIGVPFSGVEAIVVDAAGVVVADGEPGELWLGGVALARGYRSKPELTAERFIERRGERWYRTGDTVTRDTSGVLHYFGRNDDQVKVRGVRIEPMEVETAITALPGVRAAAATWFESSTGSRSIIAAVVPSPGSELSTPRLYDMLADRLPGAMIPSRFVFCDELPRSASGKVDRVAIRAKAGEMRDEHRPAPAPAGPTEGELIEIWRRTLGVHTIGLDDHFFTIGGDSLAAVTMMLDVEEAFGVSLPMRVVFEAPTLRVLAARIDAAMVCDDGWSAPSYIFPLVEGSGTPFFFCGVDLKLARRGMWPDAGPLYAVSLWAQGRGFLQARSVQDLARQQLEGITAIQPQGPYRLGGYSFGGLVAYELAHLLRARGDEVALLFLLDATEPFRTVTAPLEVHEPRPLHVRVRGRVARQWADRDTGHAVRTLGKRVLIKALNLGGRVPTWQWLNYQAVHLYGRHPGAISAKLVPKDRWPAYWYTSLRLTKSYVARPYDGRVAAVFVEEGHRSESWRSLLRPDAATVVVDTQHLTLFDHPNAARWLDFLREVLARPAG